MEDGKSLIGKSFLKNAYFGYGAQGLKIGLAFAWVTILTAVAGIQTYGMIAILTSMSGLIGNLVTFRTNEGVIKFYKRGVVEENLALCRLALLAGLVLDVVVALTLFALIRSFADSIAVYLLKNPDTAAAIITYSWVIFANFMRGTGMGLLTASERFRVIYSIAVVEQFARLTLLLLVWQSGAEVNVDTVIWIILLPALVTSVVVLGVPTIRLWSLPRNIGISLGELRDYLAFSLSTFTSSSLKAGNRGIDNMILGFLTNPEAVGIYNLFKRFLSPLSIVVAPFYAQIYPKFVEAMGSGDSEKIRYTVVHTNKGIAKWSLLLLLAIVVVVVLYWSFMSFQFRSEYIVTFLIVALTSLLFQQLWWTRGFALSYNPAISIRANLIKSVLVISLVWMFTVGFGLVGTAIGMFGVSLCMSAFWHLELSRYSRQEPQDQG